MTPGASKLGLAPRDSVEVASVPSTPLSLDDIFRRYGPYLSRVCFRILGRREDVDDVVQLTFIEAHQGLKNLRHPAAARAWLAMVAVRLSRRRLRRRRLWRLVGLEDAPEYEALADPSVSPSDQALLASVYRVLDRLPVEQRLAWTLHRVEGERLEETALLCGCSLATVKRRIAAAQHTIEAAHADP